ncbi:uncharacterized protein LOC123298134 isoform X3 [Chrysoperla carnea]|uniref:uncharacterized protein LOC123298134 isoform X3 n=1 Tax=Chrysoperla carnea TaxID=189513 RepID=UPI001D064695|nr:uncharacterized protein LOC123298134 isoform X3 [Chrysoperla carnea]
MKYCVVKNCNSGLKNLKIKRSIFKVPKDVELRKKWEAAIPGITVLGDSSCICERHFKSDDIIRKRHFKSPTGEIIGVGVLERPRLSETAIPCFFDNESDQEILKNENSNSNFDAAEVMIYEETPDIKPVDTNLDTPEVKINEETPDIKPMLNVWIDRNLLSEDKFDLSNVVVKSEPDPIASEDITQGSSIHEEFKIKDEDENTSDTTNDNNSVTSENFTQGSIHEEVVIKSEDKNDSKRTIDIDSDSKRITFSNNISSRNPILIPKSWGVINIPSENGENFLFTHSILINKNGIEFPFTCRHVKLDTNKNLKYFIHGRPVDLTVLNMSSSLFFNVEDVSNILSVFQSKTLCSGFTLVNNDHCNLKHEFIDCFGMWHSERCTLIAKLKRCSFCQTLRKTLLQKERRHNRAEPSSVNIFD